MVKLEEMTDSTLRAIQKRINDYKETTDASLDQLNDTHHSFGDLYDHRMVLTALAFIHLPYAWKTKNIGSKFKGMFLVGAPTPDGMITYHYDLEHWDLFKIPELPHEPEFDGHTPEDVVNRIKNYIAMTDSYLVNSETYPKVLEVVENQILPVFGDDLVSKARYISFYNREV